MFGDAQGSCKGCDYESSALNAVRGVNPCDQCFNYGLYKSSDPDTHYSCEFCGQSSSDMMEYSETMLACSCGSLYNKPRGCAA